MAVSRRLRFEVLKRDNYSCRYCGGKAPDVTLTVDHVIPTTLGGSDDPSNLVAACQPCNAGKTSISPDSQLVDDVGADALRWARAINTAASDWLIDRELMDFQIRHFDELWSDWFFGDQKKPIPRPLGWQDSLERFIKLGVELEALEHLALVALRNGRVVAGETWTYFCGCCWRHVKDLQNRAASIIDAEDWMARGKD